ncbi:MAG: MBL fold metallo-hydrolase [Muribaculaceae bacterium]|nr:MBL fold metallo-hydrolase [Muribaculaceae bacterium]
MRKFYFGVALVVGLSALGQPMIEFKEKTVFKNADVEFRQIDAHTWQANGNKMFNESMYLIEGETSAILIDAGTAIPGLKKIAESICKKPVVLVATHVHPDHTGASVNEWDSIWINAADEVNTPLFMPNYKGKKKYLTDGQVFDLGGRKIEVVFTPGHTPGSTTLIDAEAHYGFSGDAFGSGNLLVFTSLSTVSASCQRLLRFIDKYGIKSFYPGHYYAVNCETRQRIKDVGELCDALLEGTMKPQQQGNNTGQSLVLDARGVKICFNPEQVR